MLGFIYPTQFPNEQCNDNDSNSYEGGQSVLSTINCLYPTVPDEGEIVYGVLHPRTNALVDSNSSPILREDSYIYIDNEEAELKEIGYLDKDCSEEYINYKPRPVIYLHMSNYEGSWCVIYDTSN